MITPRAQCPTARIASTQPFGASLRRCCHDRWGNGRMSEWRGTLDQLVRERGRALFGYAYVLTGDRHDAEDLLQEALVRAFRAGAKARSVEVAHAYVKRSIATTFIDRSRRAAARPRSVGVGSDLREWGRVMASVPDHATRVELAVDLQSALLQLPPRERACIVLRFMEDMAVDAVAEALGRV
ncbi:RNA polymerase sigma factor [Demequina capsici]|uniref:Sigma-70 family RNA polymerase sigma factor n=1 Tax=Demequina capsici TaxID=3075620 RepID=A0AA96J7W7_9MICO|nr:sigma-70 family RNA polymerase sigma factor [Demequina sp. OYTSA14]WNM24433.1 sigma-70 family RNA polymerase sigma factor [Demequina sp. OYTSA14]